VPLSGTTTQPYSYTVVGTSAGLTKVYRGGNLYQIIDHGTGGYTITVR
jgi:hypothetical protein